MSLDEEAAAAFLDCIKTDQAARLLAIIEKREFVFGVCIGNHDRMSKVSSNNKTRAKVGVVKEWRGYAPLATIYYIDSSRNVMMMTSGKLSDVSFPAMRIRDAKKILYTGDVADIPAYLKKQFNLVQPGAY